jgi:hypothetical protein
MSLNIPDNSSTNSGQMSKIMDRYYYFGNQNFKKRLKKRDLIENIDRRA